MKGAIPTTTSEAHQGLETLRAHARHLAHKLSPQELNWKPGPDRWSVGQCLDHLTVTARKYATVMESAIVKAEGKVARGSGETLEPSLMGRLFLRLLQAPGRRFKVPGGFVPASAVSSAVVSEFEEAHRKLDELLVRARKLPMKRVRTRSPVTALLRLNLADCYVILLVHAERHLRQAQRVLESTDFPRS